MPEDNEEQQQIEELQEQQEQQEQMAQQQAEMQQEETEKDREKKLNTKLNLINTLLLLPFKSKLTSQEKDTIKQAKKIPKLKAKAIKIETKVKAKETAKKAKKTTMAISSGSTVAIVALILVAAIAVAMILFRMKEATEAISGINGKDFYGARMVYKDDDLAAQSIVEDYVQIVEKGVDEAKALSISGVTLEINITLPTEEFDYSTFDETEFQVSYPVLYSMVFDIAKVVYKIDNSADFAGSTLIECVSGIAYFGFDQTFMPDISKVVADAISSNTTTSDGSDVSVEITSSLNTLYSQAEYNIRTEKVFIKDYILFGEEDTIKNVATENYVSFIFMPRKNVTFTSLSFTAGNVNINEFSISLSNNGTNVPIKKDDVDLSDDEEETKQSYTFITDKINISATAFTDIDSANISALREGLSLFDIVENVDNYELYLEQTTGENSQQYYTFKKNGVVVSLEHTEKFNFVEAETKWK